ncbi:MAG: transglutaminase domain-containing protein [Candidatus Marinimicrobia bacterium]|jgi:hypothetical protein|nr:transglutaminase domain-containing protein [Candidatus Neomarinimicrobiota bacterium]MBT3634285.1 transglutaminase domain-containing protein [Candidatus Neomarinimicrobiota bacterium]MBT3682916.1 transglutaminase domain-containing protein [Candidatus Neomarinimicrobiota bacterium]MBT3760094.1 transglutaminase domain-containing protein [Candidatus Neomarinimicrobiota bacterium]MBT3896139.1 transglutaminase domain-containing protein [Candidatus Neomarinimicrobiota bacterium]
MLKKVVLILIPVLMLTSSCHHEGRSFHFSYLVELLPNEGNTTRIWLPIPQSGKHQKIQNLHIDSDIEYKLKTEETHENTYLLAEFEGGIESTKTIHLQFDVLRMERKDDMAKSDFSNYLRPTSMVPVNEKFENILDENDLSHGNMREIYDFVLDKMSYGKPKASGDKYARKFPVALSSYLSGNGWGRGDANYACDVGVGNCTDFHSYFMSLSRSSGVPARFHMGFPIPNNNEGDISGYHCWADFYDSEKGWIPVDISEADKHPELADYYFGTIDPHRVEFTIGRDLELEALSTGTTNYFIYPIMEIDGVPSNSFIKRFSYKDL